MQRTLPLVALLLLVPIVVSARPQPVQDPVLDRLVGTWVLQGTIAGQATTHDVTVDWVLGHQYVRLHEVSRETNARGQPAYEAIVFIGRDQVPGRYACLWLDTTGGGGLSGQAIGHGTPSADGLAFLFQGADGSTFHTTFRYSQASGTWQWLMDGEEGGKLVPFARVTLTRK